jgi:protease YdgD
VSSAPIAVNANWRHPIPHDSATAIPIAVFGTDDRTAVPQRYAKLQEAMGVMFNIRARTVCTAFCVAENIVATASHCLFRTAGEQAQRLAEFWFARNYDTVKDYARIAGHASGSASQNVLAGNRRLSIQPPIDATSDWALVRLARPICTKGILPVKAMSSDDIIKEASAKRIFQISYHRDYPQWRLAYSRPCEVARNFPGAEWPTISPDFSNADTLVLHTCDTGGASSGSPLLIDTAEGPLVVAINVGTYIQSRVTMQNGQPTGRSQTETVANTAVSSGAFAAKLAAFRSANIIANATEIKSLQEQLKSRGLYAGPIDGTYGPTLQTAIEDFERMSQHPVTGLATGSLLARLKEPKNGHQQPASARGIRIP